MMAGLGSVLDNHQQRCSRLWGELFALWGMLVIGVTLLEVYVWSSIWLWPAMIGVGLFTQAIYVRAVERRGGEYTLKFQRDIYVLWMSITIVLLPLVGLVLPLGLKIYTPRATVVLMSLILALGMWVSGFIGRALSFKLGGGALLVGGLVQAFILAAQKRQTPGLIWTFILTILLGMVIPGIVSRIHERQ
jgi:hypothetical protein